MRVRVLRGPSAGRVVILPEAEALALLESGAVEEDKMLSGPTEWKAPGASSVSGETGLNGPVAEESVPRPSRMPQKASRRPQEAFGEGGEASRYPRKGRAAGARRR